MSEEEHDELCRLPSGVTDVHARYQECATKTTREDAEDLLEELAEDYAGREGCSLDEARKIERANVGYWASCYLAWPVTVRVFRLFSTASPVFGEDFPEPHKAFWAGVRMTLELRGRTVRPEELAEMRLWTHDLHRWKRARGGE